VRQPWAWAIVHGCKPVENREWVPSDRYRGPLVIHAGKKLGTEVCAFRTECDMVSLLADLGGLLPDCANDVGGLVGICNVTGYVRESRSPWFYGPYGWLLDSPEPWPLIPWRGQKGLWGLTVDEQEAISVQLEGLGASRHLTT
jgi:hypothetical protein